jgi:hypothetical protein
MIGAGSSSNRLAEALADLRLRVLLGVAQRLGLPAEGEVIREKIRRMNDQEVLSSLEAETKTQTSDASLPAKIRGLWRHLLLFWPFR